MFILCKYVRVFITACINKLTMEHECMRGMFTLKCFYFLFFFYFCCFLIVSALCVCCSHIALKLKRLLGPLDWVHILSYIHALLMSL